MKRKTDKPDSPLARSQVPQRAAQSGQRLFSEFLKVQSEREFVWHNRPKARVSDLKNVTFNEPLSKALGSAERVALFEKHLDAWENNDPTLETYLALRRGFPEVHVDVDRFCDPEQFFALQPQFDKFGIDRKLIFGVLDGFMPDIDELALQLMERLVAKRNIPTRGPGHIDARRATIPDRLIDYIIVMILEIIEQKNGRISIPPSLVVLIRDRVCGSTPDIRTEYIARERQNSLRSDIFLGFVTGKLPSLRKFAALNGFSKTTAERFINEARRDLEDHEKHMQEEDYRRNIEANSHQNE